MTTSKLWVEKDKKNRQKSIRNELISLEISQPIIESIEIEDLSHKLHVKKARQKQKIVPTSSLTEEYIII